LEAETCGGNPFSTIKTACNTLERLLDIFHLIRNMLGTTIKIVSLGLWDKAKLQGKVGLFPKHRPMKEHKIVGIV
jgi:hypothetical protein